KTDDRVPIAIACAIDDGKRNALHPAGIEAIKHVREQRLVVHRVVPPATAFPRACTLREFVPGSTRAKARKSARVCASSPLATRADNAHTEERGSAPRKTSHACNSLVSAGDAVQRKSTQYQYHTRRGPSASTSLSSRAVTLEPPASSTRCAALARMRALSGSNTLLP